MKIDSKSTTEFHARLLTSAALLVGISGCGQADDLQGDDQGMLEAQSPDSETAPTESGRFPIRVSEGEDAAKQHLIDQQQALLRTTRVEFIAPDLDLVLRDDMLDSPISVDVFLDEESLSIEEPESWASVQIDADGEEYDLRLNGRSATNEELRADQERLAEVLRAAEATRRADNRARWEAVAARYGLERELAAAIDGGTSSATLTVPGQLLREIEDDRDSVPIGGIALRREAKGSDGMAGALASTEISTLAFPWGWNGTGIGVWLNDGDGRPDSTAACVDNNDLIVQDYGNEALQGHATTTLCTLQAAAPFAKIHYGVPTQACNLRSDVTTFSNPPVYVSSQSNAYGDLDSSYSNCARDWDNFVYNNRIAHFALTFNNTIEVAGAAKAYNVFAVGAYDDGATPDVMAGFSNWWDPDTGADKPEIVAPGVNITIPNGGGTTSGTSISTPIAAGFAADLLERRSFLRLQPALLKAALLTSSVSIENNPPFGTKDGAGRLDFGNASTSSFWRWNGSNNSTFTVDTDGDGRLEKVVGKWLYAGQTYRVANSWLVLGSYARAFNKPNMDIDLRVTAPNGASWSSVSVTNSHELVEFVAPVTGYYTIKSERYWNSGLGNVSLGLAVTAR